MENTRRRRSGGLRNIVTAVFAVAFVASIVSTITAFAAANLFKIQNAELSELSTTAEGSISSFDEENIVSSVTFHKLDDSAKYTITLKNTDTKDHIIESITDNNINPYISYEYDQHTGEQIDAGSDFVFVITAKYSAAITNIDQRAQVSNVKFFIHFTDVEEEILLVPNTGASSNTGNFIRFSVISLVISAAGLTIAGIFALKKYKKASKYIVAGIVAVAAITTTATVKAVTVEINSFTISTDVTLKDKVVVTYTDKNGDEQELIVNYGEPANIPDQNKNGYTLTGWEDEDGNPVDPTQPTTEDVKIHPIYRTHTYIIKFNGNGANGEMADLAMAYDETKTLPTNAFDFPGRTYTGWDTEANGSGVHYNNESEVKNLTAEDNGIVTLYAQWSINPFYIDYDGNGATSGEMATTNCEYDQVCQLRDNAFEKTGYHFIGWKYNNNDYANKADVKNIIESGTITMVAQWEVNHYTIVFDINTDDSNAAGDMADMANLEYDHDYTLTANAFTRTGYNFGGWNTEIDGRNFGLTDEQEFHNLTTTDNAVITLYAQWNPIHYNVVFHQNHDDVTGNTNSMTNIAYDDTRALTQNGFELAHYKFMGWNSAEDGTGTPYEDKASIKNLTATDGATVDLYAQWKERTATLNTGTNVRTALKGLADAPTTFKKYDGENLPDFDTLDDKVDIALADSNFPVWAWVDGDNIYWWSEAERPNFNRNSSTMFQSMTTLTTINLDGLESSTAVNMSYLFNGCTSLTDLDISEFNTANVENTSAMFRNTPALTSINTAVLNTANVKDMSSMFRETGAASIDISGFDTTNVKTMVSMFEKTKASSITLGNPNTLNVTNMANMFQDTLNLTSLDVSGLDTDNVESMNNMFMAFNGTPKLTSLDLSNFKTSKVKNFSGMFYGQSKITSLDVSNFNTSSATTMYMMFQSMKAQSINVSGWTNDLGPEMSYMFSFAGTVGTVINFDNFNTENVTNMNHMFADMRSQTVLDLSSFDTAKVKNMSGMFSSSYASTPMALKTVYVSDKFVTTALTSDANNIFANARVIVGGAGTTWDASSIEKARIDDPDNGEPGYFTYKNARYVRYHDNDGDDTNDETNYALMKSHYLKAGDSLTKNAFTRRGFRFTGWKDADNNEYTDEQAMTELTESKTPLELYAQWEELTATLNTGANVNAALRGLTAAPTTFKQFDGENLPDFDNLDGKVDIALSSSDTPVWAWADGDTIYWWSEAETVYMNASTYNLFGNMSTIKTIDLAGLDPSNIVNATNMFIATTNLETVTGMENWRGDNLENAMNMFKDSGIISVSIPNLITSKATNIGNMFYNCQRLTAVDADNWDVSGAEKMSSMFYNTYALQTISGIEKWEGKHLQTTHEMFGHSGIEMLNVGKLVTEATTDVSGMFSYSNITYLDLSDFDFSNVENMFNMFAKMSAIESIIFPDDINTSKVTTMAGLFNDCPNLRNADVSNFDTTNVKDMNGMFRFTPMLANVDVSGFDTSSLEGAIESMFSKNGTAVLDLTTFDTSRINIMRNLFLSNTAITTIYASDDFKTELVPNQDVNSDGHNLFKGATNLVGGAGTSYANSPNNNKEYARIDDPDNGEPGYFTPKNARYVRYNANVPDGETVTGETKSGYLPAGDGVASGHLTANGYARAGYKFMGWATSSDGAKAYDDGAEITIAEASKEPLSLYAVWLEKTSDIDVGLNTKFSGVNPDATELKKYSGTPDFASINDEVIVSTDNSNFPTYIWSEGDTIYYWSEADKIFLNQDSYGAFGYSKFVKLDLSGMYFDKIVSMNRFFRGSDKLEEIIFPESMNTSSITTFEAAFYGCNSLKSIDLSSFANSSVTDIREMFYNNTGLKELDMSGWDFSNIENRSLWAPTNVETINFSNVVAHEDMSDFFKGLTKLTSINLSNVNTSNTTNMRGMFSGDTLLQSINVGSFNTSSVSNMAGMFNGCSSLSSIDVSGFDVKNVESFSSMFDHTAISTLDLSNWETTDKLTNMYSMFGHNAALSTLKLGPNFNTSKVTTMNRLFVFDTSLVEVDLGVFDTSSLQDTESMFHGATNLKTIYVSDGFKNSNISNPAQMFYGTSSLRGGAGTAWNSAMASNKDYARIDDPDNGEPGYFTTKGARYIRYNGNGADNTTPYGAMRSEYLKAGDSLKKNAFTRGGYVFTDWKDADNNEYTDEQVMANLTESKTPLELYAQWDTAPYAVTFNANGGEVLQSAKTVTYLQPYGELPTPVRYDYDTTSSMLSGKYEFKEWNTKADGTGDTITSSSVYTNTDNTTLYAIWNNRFTVTIYNGESETPTIANYGIDSVVDLNAQNVAGKQFLYWEVDGAKKSYNKDYGMRMFQGKDLTIRAIYGSESDLESQQPGTYISDIYRQYSGNKIVARSYSYVPDGYKIVRAGVIATLDANIANGTFDDQTATYVRPNEDNDNIDDYNYYFTWSKSNVTSEQTVYVKAYLKYKDVDGVEHTIYGDLVTATLTE